MRLEASACSSQAFAYSSPLQPPLTPTPPAPSSLVLPFCRCSSCASRSPRVLSPRHRSTPPSGRDCWHGVDAGTHFYAGLAYAIICCSHPHLVLCLPGLISLGLSHGSHLTATSRNRHGLTPLSHQPLSLRRFEYDFELHATFCTKPRNEFEMASICTGHLLQLHLLGDIACLISSLLVGWELEVQTLFSSSGYPPLRHLF